MGQVHSVNEGSAASIPPAISSATLSDQQSFDRLKGRKLVRSQVSLDNLRTEVARALPRLGFDGKLAVVGHLEDMTFSTSMQNHGDLAGEVWNLAADVASNRPIQARGRSDAPQAPADEHGEDLIDFSDTESSIRSGVHTPVSTVPEQVIPTHSPDPMHSSGSIDDLYRIIEHHSPSMDRSIESSRRESLGMNSLVSDIQSIKPIKSPANHYTKESLDRFLSDIVNKAGEERLYDSNPAFKPLREAAAKVVEDNFQDMMENGAREITKSDGYIGSELQLSLALFADGLQKVDSENPHSSDCSIM